MRAGLLRPRVLWPFPDTAVRRAAAQARAVVVAEMNLGQWSREVERVVGDRVPILAVHQVNSTPIEPDRILGEVHQALEAVPVSARRTS